MRVRVAPVLATGAPVAGSGAKASLLGTVKRTDGRLQVTYAGHPLYYFSGHMTSRDVSGQGVNGFGAHWDAVRPSGAQAGWQRCIPARPAPDQQPIGVDVGPAGSTRHRQLVPLL